MVVDVILPLSEVANNFGGFLVGLAAMITAIALYLKQSKGNRDNKDDDDAGAAG